MELRVIDQADLKNKKVFVRGDIDIALNPLDDTRLKDIFPTIDFLLKQECTVILAGHLGRPAFAKASAGKLEGKEDLKLSSRPVAEWFKRKMGNGQWAMGNEVSGICLKGNICGFLVTEKLIVLENLRFDPKEEANDEEFAKELASLADVYVNEAFATSWENHASIVGVPKLLPHFAGFRLAKEVEMLERLLENPARPMVAVIGGVKLESKLPAISNLAKVADTVIVGGRLLEEKHELRIMNYGKVKFLELAVGGKDVTTESIDQVAKFIAEAKTIVWAGPLGMVEDFTYQVGSRMIAELIIANSGAYRVVGGGDTVAFLDKLGLTNKFDWVSSGGGSMLKFLSGEKLPGITALTE